MPGAAREHESGTIWIDDHESSTTGHDGAARSAADGIAGTERAAFVPETAVFAKDGDKCGVQREIRVLRGPGIFSETGYPADGFAGG